MWLNYPKQFCLTTVDADGHGCVLLGVSICLQSTGRPSRLPGRLVAEAQHGDTGTEPCNQGKSTADW